MNSGTGDTEKELLVAVKALTCEIAALRLELASTRKALADAEELVGELRAQNEQLTARNAELAARLGADSTNSSRPPSTDPPTARQRSLRVATGRKPGGQAGHPGTTLEPDLGQISVLVGG